MKRRLGGVGTRSPSSPRTLEDLGFPVRETALATDQLLDEFEGLLRTLFRGGGLAVAGAPEDGAGCLASMELGSFHGCL